MVAGTPAKPTTVVVGRTDLTEPTGYETPAISIIPHPDRNLALVRLSRRMVGIPAIPIAATEPAAAETLTVSGYGRTATEWVPNRLHAASFTVQDVNPKVISIVGATAGATICEGDAGVRYSEIAAATRISWRSTKRPGRRDAWPRQHPRTARLVPGLTTWRTGSSRTPHPTATQRAGPQPTTSRAKLSSSGTTAVTAQLTSSPRIPLGRCGAGTAPATCRQTTGYSLDQASRWAAAGPPQHSPGFSRAAVGGQELVGRPPEVLAYDSLGTSRLFEVERGSRSALTRL